LFHKAYKPYLYNCAIAFLEREGEKGGYCLLSVLLKVFFSLFLGRILAS